MKDSIILDMWINKKIHKKKDKRVLDNYLGILLVNVGCKILLRL